jgi:hypothetical protein
MTLGELKIALSNLACDNTCEVLITSEGCEPLKEVLLDTETASGRPFVSLWS